MNDDQERLLADALRAQATSASMTPSRPEDLTAGTEGGQRAPARPVPPRSRPSVPAAWVLLLALLLGLAAGTVAALITLR